MGSLMTDGQKKRGDDAESLGPRGDNATALETEGKGKGYFYKVEIIY